MTDKGLMIHNRTIISTTANATSTLPTPAPQLFPKPLSTSLISLFPSSEIQQKLVLQMKDASCIPQEFCQHLILRTANVCFLLAYWALTNLFQK